MKKYALYPFYSSIRFRFGLLFNCLLLLFLSVVIFLLYKNVTSDLEQSFRRRLTLGANIILQKTDVSPVTIPIPQAGEYFLLTYNNKVRTDTLFNNLPIALVKNGRDSIYRTEKWWGVQLQKKLETNGLVSINYLLSADEYRKSVDKLKTLLFIYIPACIVLAFIAGYFLSGIFLRPLKKMIGKTNRIDLVNDIKLLDEPLVKDELHELTDAINRMLARIKKQSQQQQNFFASASHELRTPLSTMMTELQTTDITTLPSATKTLIANQLAEVKRLNDLVNNFLWMSQLKSDASPVHATTFNLAELCIEIIGSQKSLANKKEQTFTLNFYPESSDFIIFADRGQLSIALSNLISNAIKYGLANTPISILLTQNEQFKLTIENSTDLIIENANELKSEFKRGVHYPEGFGLGLWLAEQFLLRNRGTLQLQVIKNRFIAELILPVA